MITDMPEEEVTNCVHIAYFKHAYETESYLTDKLPYVHRSAMAKFRCGVAPLKIETGRYENIPLEARICFNL